MTINSIKIKEFIKEANAIKTNIGLERDRLREIADNINELCDNIGDFEEEFRSAMDTLSQLV